MPVYLRRFYLRELESAKNEEKKQIDKISKKSSKTSVHRPGIRR